MRNLGELIEARAAELGDKTYLVCGDEELTYAVMASRTAELARGLLALGIAPGDRVALLVKNSPRFVLLWWALLRLGAVMVPVNLRLTAGEAAYVIDHSGARAVALGDQCLPLLEELKAQCPGVAHWLAADEPAPGLVSIDDLFTPGGAALPGPGPGLDDDAVILYTSGTTGFPKGVVHSQGDYLRTGASFACTAGLDPADRLLTANPLFHVNAQFYSAMGSLWTGCTLVLAEKFSASRWWGWTRHYQTNKAVMLLALTTILWNQEPRADDADNPVEQIVAGGMVKGHYHDFERRFGVRLQTLYSLTEAPLAVMGPRGEPCVDGAVGVAMESAWPGEENRVAVHDDQDRPVPPEVAGEIVLQNPALMSRYLDNPQATAEALRGGWLHTGDRGRMDLDGILYFLGRAKDVIRVKGENVGAGEVETVLVKHPAVAEAAVIGVTPPDAVGDEAIMACVVAVEGAAPDWDDLVAHCAGLLADFKVPRFWRQVEELPKNAMNRVVKERLKDSEHPEAQPGVHDRGGRRA